MPVGMEPGEARRTRTGGLSAVGSKKSEEKKDRISRMHETVGRAAMARWVSSPASGEGDPSGERDQFLSTILSFESLSDSEQSILRHRLNYEVAIGHPLRLNAR